MPFTIERNDLAYMSVDAVVVTANEGLQINGGSGLAVAREAGLAELQAACDAIGGCPTGSAVATPGFALTARTIVHVVGPVWQGGTQNEEAVLRKAYDSALACANNAGARSIALPLISAHTFGFPVRLSFVIAVEAVKAFLEEHESDVHIVLYGEDALAVGLSLFDDIAEYIDDHYVEMREEEARASYAASFQGEQPLQAPAFGSFAPERYAQSAPEIRQPASSGPQPYANAPAQLLPLEGGRPKKPWHAIGRIAEAVGGAVEELREKAQANRKGEDAVAEQLEGYAREGDAREGYARDEMVYEEALAAPAPAAMPDSSYAGSLADTSHSGNLSDWLDSLDAPFSTTLLALIDERGMDDVEVYKRANMSRQLFSKIRSDATYRPAKKTVLALAIAMRLDLGETEDLLRRAGFALSHSTKSDVIVEYFIVTGNHDIFAVNEALYAFDQPLL